VEKGEDRRSAYVADHLRSAMSAAAGYRDAGEV
jgi:hypothetical protein